MKKILTIIIILLVFLLTPLTAIATNKYEINNVDFLVELQENGDAIITEKWEVNYISGNFSRFYKDIYTNVSNAERFSSIQIFNCKINGKEAIMTDSIDKIDYHYYFEKNKDRFTIHWFLNTQEEIVTYELKYKLKNIVKLTDKNKAIFIYRFIGNNFNDTIKNVSINIKLPQESIIEYNGDLKNEISNNSIQINKEHSIGLTKISISMDAEIFKDDLIYISTSNNIFSDRLDIFLFLALCVTIIIKLIPTIKEKIKYANAIKENPNIINDICNECENLNISPLEIAKSLKCKNFAKRAFVTTLLTLLKNEILEITDEYLIYYENNKLTEYEYLTINILKNNVMCIEEQNKFCFILKDLENLISDKDKKFFNELEKTYEDVEESNLSQDKLSLLKCHFEFKEFINFYDYYCIIKETGTIKYTLLLTSMIGQKTYISDNNVNNNSFFTTLDTMLYVNNENSSSSGWGCSSCSSCSSCGGGGAD